MSRRTSIVKALVEKLKEIDGTGIYKTNLYANAHAALKFWDEIDQYPAVYVTPGSEQREYLPAEFTWGYLGIAIKIYCRGDEVQGELENLLEDVESCIDRNRVLVYDISNNYETTEILVQSITTDEGLLAPYGVGEINLQVRYQVM